MTVEQFIKPIATEENIRAIFDDNENYFSSYTGTPMLMSDKAVPKIMELIIKEQERLKKIIEFAYYKGREDLARGTQKAGWKNFKEGWQLTNPSPSPQKQDK